MIIIRDGKKYKLTPDEMRKAFREMDLEYMKEDAEEHCNDFNEWYERDIAFTEDDYKEIANEFADNQDCDQPDNAVYESIVKDYVESHFNADDSRKEGK